MRTLEQFLLWGPVLWTGRLALLIVLVGGGWCAALYFTRFFRRKHIKAIWNANPPKLSGRLSVPILGASAGLNLDHTQDEQVASIDARLKEIERAQELQGKALRAIVRRVFKEVPNAERD